MGILAGKGIERGEHILNSLLTQPQSNEDMPFLGGGSTDGIVAGNIKIGANAGQGGIGTVKGCVEFLYLRTGCGLHGDGVLLHPQGFFQPGKVHIHSVDQGIHLLGNAQLQPKLVQLPLVVRPGGEGALPQPGIEQHQLGALPVEKLIDHALLDLLHMILKGIPQVVDIVLCGRIKLLGYHISPPKSAGDLNGQKNQQQRQHRSGQPPDEGEAFLVFHFDSSAFLMGLYNGVRHFVKRTAAYR